MWSVIKAMIANAWGRPFLYGLARKGLSEEGRFELRCVGWKKRIRHEKIATQKEGPVYTKALGGKEIAIFQELRESLWSLLERKVHEMNLESQEGLVHTTHNRLCRGVPLCAAEATAQITTSSDLSLWKKALQQLCGKQMLGAWCSKNKSGKNYGKCTGIVQGRGGWAMGAKVDDNILK